MIDTEDSSEKTKEMVDRLIDHEIDLAYKRATEMLKENSKLHNILIDAMLKFKTLGRYFVFEIFATNFNKKSLKKIKKINILKMFCKNFFNQNLDLEEIDLVIKSRSLSAVERSRSEHERTRTKARKVQEKG